jgi:sugar phosphate permease
VILAAVVAPVLWRRLRDRPEDVGLEPIGGPLAAPADDPATGAAPTAIGLRGLARSRGFWSLAIPFFVCGITTTGFVDTHLIPLAQDRGIPVATAGLAVALLAAANVTGILASGPLADRVDNRLLLAALYGTRGVSFVVLALLVSGPALVGFAMLFGLVDFAVARRRSRSPRATSSRERSGSRSAASTRCTSWAPPSARGCRAWCSTAPAPTTRCSSCRSSCWPPRR